MVTALTDLRANYFGGLVRMTWLYPAGAPESVHIFVVRNNGYEMTFDNRFAIARDLRDCPGGITFEYNSVSNVDVQKVTFCVYLEDRNAPVPPVQKLLAIPECFVDVTIGRAHVLFDVKRKPCDPYVISHRFILRSTSTFEAGILGYSYDFFGKTIKNDFPGTIGYGINVFPPVYLLRDTPPPLVAVTGGANSDILIEYRKITTFRKSSLG